MMIFTDWIPDLDTRYTLGYVYLPCLTAVVFINIACVVFDMGYGFVKQYKLKQKKNKLEHLRDTKIKP